MDQSNLLLIQEREGFTPQIGHLVSMMNYARHTTLGSVTDLSIEQLDYLHDENSNSIGALLYHIAAVDFIYHIGTFENRDMTKAEEEKWLAGLQLGTLGRQTIKGHPLDFYTQLLDETRQATLAALRQKDDSWLYEKKKYADGTELNNYWYWFHVFEDEINHRGQIRWLRKRALEM